MNNLRFSAGEVKRFNRNLIIRQFPETDNNTALDKQRKKRSKEENFPSFSPKTEYKWHVLNKDGMKKAFSDPDLISAPAYSLGSRGRFFPSSSLSYY